MINFMNKNYTIVAATLYAGSLIFSACGGKDQSKQAGMQAPAAVPVEVSTVQEEQVTGSDTYPGTVVPLNEVELRAEVNGYITKIFVKDGQTVSKGQKLYEIDRSRYEAAYNQARAQVQVAKANLEKAKKDAERYNRLAEQDAVAKQRVDYAQTDLLTAQANVTAAEASLSSVQTDLRRSVIIAPASGKIGISQAKLGSLVTAGSTLINTISSANPIGVDISIDEKDISRFTSLQRKAAADSLFTIQLPDRSKITGSGRIVAVDRAVDSQTGTLKVRISFPNSSDRLTPGMNCTVSVLNTQTGKQLTIPYKAISEQLGEFTVFVVGDSNKVEQRNVSLGMQVNDKVVVKDGLKVGETIVTEGVLNLRNGSVVQTEDPAKAGQTAPAPAKK